MSDEYVNGEQKEFKCVFAEHAQDVFMLQKQTARLVETQKELNITQQNLVDKLGSLDGHLGDGFSLGEKVIKMFTKVVLVFLVVVAILGAIIVHLTNVKLEMHGISIEAVKQDESGLPQKR